MHYVQIVETCQYLVEAVAAALLVATPALVALVVPPGECMGMCVCCAVRRWRRKGQRSKAQAVYSSAHVFLS